jgi:hypothetical protein
MPRPCARPKKRASAVGPSIAEISLNSGFSGSTPRDSTVFSSMKLVYIAPSRCISGVPLSPAAAASSRIACTSACAFSNSMIPMPALAYSGGNGVLSSQVPFTKRNRSSCGRTALFIVVGSMPETSGAGALSAQAAANDKVRTAGRSLRRDMRDFSV